ncbi:MAG: FGGY-family carbohydrate kinase, partial [Dongiaceae bacterium]
PWDRLVGVPVYTSSMDTWCAALGLGANGAGCAYIVSGTTEACGVIGAERRPAEGLVTLPWGGGLFQTGGPSHCGTGTLDWVAARVGIDDWAGVLRTARPDDIAAPSLLFFPYLEGERVPFWEPRLRGAFVGLDRRHEARDLLLAAIRGLAFVDAQILLRAAGERMDRVTDIRIGGGPARADAWCELRADVLGRAVSRPSVDEPGLFGCAMLVFAGAAAAVKAVSAQPMLSATSIFEPRAALHARYERLYAQFVALQPALIATGRGLAAADP